MNNIFIVETTGMFFNCGAEGMKNSCTRHATGTENIKNQ